jgi:hypothetical protein
MAVLADKHVAHYVEAIICEGAAPSIEMTRSCMAMQTSSPWHL